MGPCEATYTLHGSIWPPLDRREAAAEDAPRRPLRLLGSLGFGYWLPAPEHLGRTDGVGDILPGLKDWLWSFADHISFLMCPSFQDLSDDRMA